jgi:hypothetical protein
MTKTVIYHSWEWACLVERGWITMYVDGDIATMVADFDDVIPSFGGNPAIGG